MILSEFNPIRLVDSDSDLLINQVHPTLDPVNFFQRWQPDDTIKFQFNLPAADTDFLYSLYRFRNLSTGKYTDSELAITTAVVGDRRYFSCSLPLDVLTTGIYRFEFEVTMTTLGGKYQLISEPLFVDDEHPDTMLLTYRPYTGDDLIALEGFWQLSDYYNFRIEGGVNPVDIQHLTEDRSIEIENKTFKIISSDIYRVENFTFGDRQGIPEWLAMVLNIALTCEFLSIDNIRYVKNDGAGLEREERNSFLSPYKCELKKYDTVLSREITAKQDVGSFDDSFDNSFEI